MNRTATFACAVLLALIPALPAADAGVEEEQFHAHGTYAGFPMTLSISSSEIIVRYCHDLLGEEPTGVYAVPYDEFTIHAEETGYRVEVRAQGGWYWWRAHYTHDDRLIAGYGVDLFAPLAAAGGAPPPCDI